MVTDLLGAVIGNVGHINFALCRSSAVNTVDTDAVTDDGFPP